MATARTAGVPGRRLLIVAGAVLGALVLGYVLLVLKSGDAAAVGTTVQGVDIGGMSQADAQTAVEEQLSPLAAKKVKVTSGDLTFPIHPVRAGITIDAAASVAPAYGHIWNPLALVAHLWSGSELPAVLAVDEIGRAHV